MFPMKESFESSGRHKRFDYLWSEIGLRMSQISMFQLTLRKTDSEQQLQTSSFVVAFNFFHYTSLNISIWDPITCREIQETLLTMTHKVHSSDFVYVLERRLSSAR